MGLKAGAFPGKVGGQEVRFPIATPAQSSGPSLVTSSHVTGRAKIELSFGHASGPSMGTRPLSAGSEDARAGAEL